MFNVRLNAPQFITYTLAHVTQAPIKIFLAANSSETFKACKNKMYLDLQFYLHFIYGRRIFSSQKSSDTLRAQNRPPPPFGGHGQFLPGIKLSGHEFNHLPLSSVGVKNEWRFTSVSAYMDKLTLTFRLVGWTLGNGSERGTKFTNYVDKIETSLVQSVTLNLRYFCGRFAIGSNCYLLYVILQMHMSIWRERREAVQIKEQTKERTIKQTN
jgi:hypothetical protein